MKIKSIKVIKGKNKWSESKTKLIHMVLDLGEFEQKPSNKIDGFYERIKKHLPSLKSHRCSIGKPGGFFQRIKEGTWMGHIIEHVALELQTLAGYDTGWGRTRGVKGQKGVYNVVFNFENEECGKLAAKEAFNVVNDIINDKDPQIDKIVKKLESKTLIESIKKILREELNESAFFFRRINLDEVKKLLPINAEQVYGETKSYEQFKYELTLRAVEAIMWNEYELGWEDLPEQEEIDFVTEVSDMLEKDIKQLYKRMFFHQ